MTTLFIEMAINIKSFIFFKIKGSQNETPMLYSKQRNEQRVIPNEIKHGKD